MNVVPKPVLVAVEAVVEYPKYTNKLYLQNPSLNPTSNIPRPFMAGNLYEVNLNVSGHNDITLSTKIKGWDEAGNGEADTEIRPGEQVKQMNNTQTY